MECSYGILIKMFPYVMLGALVTRFAVLFTAGGPAGRFVPITKTEEKEQTENEKNSE